MLEGGEEGYSASDLWLIGVGVFFLVSVGTSGFFFRRICEPDLRYCMVFVWSEALRCCCETHYEVEISRYTTGEFDGLVHNLRTICSPLLPLLKQSGK